MIKTLSYISNVNKNQRKIDDLMDSPMKNMNITFNEDKCTIEYEEYNFNEKEITEEKEKKEYYDDIKKEEVEYYNDKKKEKKEKEKKKKK